MAERGPERPDYLERQDLQDTRKNLEMRNGFDPYSSVWSELGITAPQVKPTGRAANDISDSLIDTSSIIARGHSKIIGHYRQLLNRDLTPAERADIEARIRSASRLAARSKSVGKLHLHETKSARSMGTDLRWRRRPCDSLL